MQTLAAQGPHVQKEILEHAAQTRVILSPKVEAFAPLFIAHKQKCGTVEEKAIYAHMSVDAFFDRLLRKRPLAFLEAQDHYLLRSGVRGKGWILNNSTPAISMQEYLSYDEICVAALLGVSVPTHFINNGTRSNLGRPTARGTFEPKGVLTGLAGARFERQDVMEAQFLLVQPQCTEKRGFGAQRAQSPWLELWASLYDVPYFPTLQEASHNRAKFLRLPTGNYLNIELYKKRIRLVAEPFLVDANDRAGKLMMTAFVHAMGIGLGVWKVHEQQRDFMTQVYAELFTEQAFPNISDVHLGFLPKECTTFMGAVHGGTVTTPTNKFRVHLTPRELADPVPAGRLLVAMYAWDGNAFPGNEYWLGLLGASGDPAAAACSTIAELQNPYINPFLTGNHRFTGQ